MLRNYQTKALEEIRAHYNKGAMGVLCVLPTGAGKSRLFVEIMKAAALRGNSSIMVVRGKSLVLQAAAVFESQGVKASVIMAGDKRFDETSLISVGSVDTLFARKIVPNVKLLVLDEAHLCLSASFKWLISMLPGVRILAVTATPFHPEGFRMMASEIVHTTNVRSLIEAGFLMPARYFSPSIPDLSTVKKSKGDFVVKDLAEAMNQSRLFGDVIKSYQTLGGHRPAVLFAVNVEHSKRLAKAFNDALIPALHVDANSSAEDREEAISLLSRGLLRVICNVGILGTGVDIPSISCIIMCRPTLSFNLHIQMLGRGSRPSPGKKDFIVLDHASNLLKHGFYEQDRAFGLDGKEPVVRLALSVCKKCFATYRTAEGSCTGILPDGEICGEVPVPKPQKRELKVDESVELTELSAEALEREQFKRWVLKTCLDAATAGRKPGFCFMQIKSRYGLDAAKASWPIIRECYA